MSQIIENNHYKTEFASWDTQHFGVKCAKIKLINEISKNDICDIRNYINDFEFITVFNINNNNVNNIVLGEETNAYLVDMNIIFEKHIIEHTFLDEKYFVKNNFASCNEISAIAKETFIHSRFLNDPHLDKKLSSQIYEKWICDSYLKEDKYFLVYKNNDVITGFILFSFLNKDKIIIELLSVNKLFQRKGIGKLMLCFLEMYSLKHNINTIEVGTQISNLAAQRLYCSCGYRISKYISIYHWWNRKI